MFQNKLLEIQNFFAAAFQNKGFFWKYEKMSDS